MSIRLNQPGHVLRPHAGATPGKRVQWKPKRFQVWGQGGTLSRYSTVPLQVPGAVRALPGQLVSISTDHRAREN